MRDIPTNPECFANHLGAYLIEERYLSRAVAAIKAGSWPVDMERPSAKAGGAGGDGFDVTGPGIAVLQVAGPMMKGWSKYPHTNTVGVRRGLRAAVRDERVKAIVLHIDSPGGTVAGTQELADDVREADKVKPVYAYGDDLVASAAYWVASQARSITANRTAEVGSIGTLAVVDDLSGMYELAGVTTHVISTGAYKGSFVEGAPVTQKQLDYLQTTVEDLNAHFLAGVQAGRGLKGKALDRVSDGRVWIAEKAKGLGLIDEVGSLDGLMERIASDLDREEARRRARRARARVARDRLGGAGG